MLTGNKGEWSEVYALFKLLADGKLYVGDKNLNKIPEVFYPIIKVLRTETSGTYEFSIKDELVFISGASEILRIKIETFKDQALFLFNAIKAKKIKSKGSFSVPEIEEFMRNINCISLKAGSSKKTDITIVIHDLKTNQQPSLGFSIKSQLGALPTLFNAVEASNFIYEVSGNFTQEKINEINSFFIKRGEKLHRDVKRRTKEILSNGGTLIFKGVQKPVFANNLMLIDSRLPELLSEVVLSYYSGISTNLSTIANLLESENPLHYDKSNSHQYYNYKLKRFLTDSAVGMLPSRVWNGIYDATGGYLVVKTNGEIVCYNLYNRNEFEEYLLNNTKLETPSTSKHGFGDLFINEDRLFFKLNLQIRFSA